MSENASLVFAPVFALVVSEAFGMSIDAPRIHARYGIGGAPAKLSGD